MVIDRTYVHGGKSPRRNQQDSNAQSSSWPQEPTWHQQWEHQGQGRPMTPRQKNRPQCRSGQVTTNDAWSTYDWSCNGAYGICESVWLGHATHANDAARLCCDELPAALASSPRFCMQGATFGLTACTDFWTSYDLCHGSQFCDAANAPDSYHACTTSGAHRTMLKEDVAELPPHIQKKVKEKQLQEGAKEGARATRDLHAAATSLGHARNAYENAILARSQLHQNWKKFLSDAVQVRLWQDYAAQLTQQERRLQEQIALTKETFFLARQNSAKAHDAAGAVQEINSDEEFGDVPAAPSSSAQTITETMNGLTQSLQNLQQQAAAIDPEAEAHTAKRPRTRPPTETDENTGDGKEPPTSFG